MKRIGILGAVGLAAILLAGCQTGPNFIGAGTANRNWQPVVATFGGVPMVRVPDGCFVMGRNGGPADEQPARRVCLTAFWIGQTEVTNAQYFACVEAGVCTPPEPAFFFAAPSYADHPVVNVTWEQADTYARWRGGRLPTEAQWEYAARGTQGWPYPWGEARPTCDVANVSTCRNSTAPVGPDRRPDGASWVGALDMAGNVWEWVNGWYDSATYVNTEEGAVNPAGAGSGQMRVLRGGAWGDEVERARSTFRSRHLPTSADDQRGFRIVLYGQPDQ